MELFLNFGNLLNSNWELISTHPMLFVLYGVLVVALTLAAGRRFFVKTKVDLELLREKSILEDGFCREQEKNRELERKSRRLTEEGQKLQAQLEDGLRREQEKNRELEQKNRRLTGERQKLQAQNEEQRKQLSKLISDNLRLFRELDQLKKTIRQALEEAQIAKRIDQGCRVWNGENNK